MYHYPQYSGVTLLHFLDWKSKPKWLEEVTVRHANGFKSRTEPLLHLTLQQALQIARTPRGLQRERPIDSSNLFEGLIFYSHALLIFVRGRFG